MVESARVRRGDRWEKTRGRIVEAASRAIESQGYEAFALEAVAAAAGVTRRTIYDHFRNREDLIVAVISRRRARQLPAAEPGQTLAAYLAGLAQAVIAMSAGGPQGGRGAAAFELYALSHENMRQRVLAQNRELYPRIAANLVEVLGADALGMPPDRFVRALHALVDGMAARRRLMPEEFNEEVVTAAFAALGGR